MTPLLALSMPGPLEMIVIAGIGLLIFGKRLPEVGKGLARSIVEFKKGLREVTEEVEHASTTTVTTVSTPTKTTVAQSPSPLSPLSPPPPTRGL